jgi:hypothetical protein
MTYAAGMRLMMILTCLAITGCSASIYTKDGVTDGDTFYLAPRAYSDDDPVLQSWVAYSLMKSACQLELGGANPARNSDYGCEFTARRHLLEAWESQRAEHADANERSAISGALTGRFPRRSGPQIFEHGSVKTCATTAPRPTSSDPGTTARCSRCAGSREVR